MTDKNNAGSASRYSRELLTRNVGLLTLVIVITTIVLGCKNCSQPEPQKEGKAALEGGAEMNPSTAPRDMVPEGHPPIGTMPVPEGHPPIGTTPVAVDPHKKVNVPVAQVLKGTVLETMEASRYTYVLLEDASAAKHWVAAPVFDVKVGDVIMVPTGMQMKDFHSKTLDRTFEYIYFTGGVKKVEEAAK